MEPQVSTHEMRGTATPSSSVFVRNNRDDSHTLLSAVPHTDNEALYRHSCSQGGEIIIPSNEMPPALKCRQTTRAGLLSLTSPLSPTDEVWLFLQIFKVVLCASIYAIPPPRKDFFRILPRAVLSCSSTLSWESAPQGGLPRLLKGKKLALPPPHLPSPLGSSGHFPGITCLLSHCL